MKKSSLRKLFFSTLLLWLCTAGASIAQTPAADIDSITEDSYQRMLERQATASDTTISKRSASVLSELASKERHYWYYLIGVFVSVGVLLILWYYRRISKMKDILEK